MEALPESLRPPQLFSLVANDVAQPTKEELDEALAKSRNYWYLLGSVAHAMRDNGLLPEYTDPRLSLRRVPRFQARPEETVWHPSGASRDGLGSEAWSTWKVSNHRDCDGLKKEVTKYLRMKLASGKAVPVKLDGQTFCTWIGTTEETPTDSNYIGVLALGWCYVLSARLIELRGEEATLSYTDSEAEFEDDSTVDCSEAYKIDIGEVDDDIARWWSAILAPNQGWEAIVTQIQWEGKSTITSHTRHRLCFPLSAEKAFRALSEFALLHELGSQFSISLAVALMIPSQDYWQLTARLPPLRIKEGQTKPCPSIDSMPQSWQRYMEDIDYYMTLSSNAETMWAALCGCFWEPEVPCNLVSPWLHPVVNEVLSSSSMITAGDQEIFALICAIRRPSLSALCIGAIMTGLGSKILQRIENGNPPVDDNAFAWTGAPQCYLDLAGVGSYTLKDSEYILRQDIWRLLHLPTTDPDDDNFNRRPFSSWPPCGKSLIKHCALRVIPHLKCPRHEYQYDHLKWALEEGCTLDDYGYSRELSTSPPRALADVVDGVAHLSFEQKELDDYQDESRKASFQAFLWLAVNDEGVPTEPVYQDEWVKRSWCLNEQEDEEDSDDDDDRSSKVMKEKIKVQTEVESWLASNC
ncbi:hypothetical protein N7452_003677 [Penicillium brevicompactum]|uniref:Uncharacterized protein n=1 Tax=Penicillium brevicompactum TaxID=5074 RepID=A0A9W9QWE5_PENBR|nr:hypothetical protein N7452_003677 [Penicillium brevicompactum]